MSAPALEVLELLTRSGVMSLKDLERQMHRAYKIQRAIATLRQDKLSVSTYYTKLKSLWDEAHDLAPLLVCSYNVCSCDLKKQVIEMREKEYLYDFLIGLDDMFATVKTKILSSQPIPSVGIVYYLVAQDEQHCNISTSQDSCAESTTF